MRLYKPLPNLFGEAFTFTFLNISSLTQSVINALSKYPLTKGFVSYLERKENSLNNMVCHKWCIQEKEYSCNAFYARNSEVVLS